VQKAILGLVVTFAAVSCTGVNAATPDASQLRIQIQPTGSPFVRVSYGSVTGLVPHGWHAVPLDGIDFHEGFVASPQPTGWPEVHPQVAGIAATWIDATRVGVPSDLYYLAAGPMLAGLNDRAGCNASFPTVFADHPPAFLHGGLDSTGDYVARGGGVCQAGDGRETRWSYFVAAPGFGPAGRLGIPGSGLYLVVAATRESPHARDVLGSLLSHIRFGHDRISDFVRAVQQEV